MWNFGDGSEEVIAGCGDTIIYNFPYGGSFNVTMTVVTDNGCDGYFNKVVNTNCALNGTVMVGSIIQLRASTNTSPPPELNYIQGKSIPICQIPDEADLQVLMGWFNLDVDCCATYPIYIQPRVAGNYLAYGTTSVRTGATEFTYTAKHCITNPGIDRVFKIHSPSFDVNYNGPYSNIPIWFEWVSGPKNNACNIDIILSTFACGAIDNLVFGYFVLGATNNPC